MSKRKFGTGKPARVKGGKVKRKPRNVLLAEAAATLLPLATVERCTALQAQLYLGGIGLPMIYKMIKAGELQSYVEDGRRWITPESIKLRALPPGQRPSMGKPVKFARIRHSPNPRAVGAAA
jgi:hypothetical protein